MIHTPLSPRALEFLCVAVRLEANGVVQKVDTTPERRLARLLFRRGLVNTEWVAEGDYLIVTPTSAGRARAIA